MGKSRSFDERTPMSLLSVPMSRRTLFRRIAAAGLATPVVAGLLAACGDDDEDVSADPAAGDDDSDDAVEDVDEDPADDSDSDDDASDSPATADDRRGGQLRIAMPAPPENFDPQNNLGFESIWPNSQIYSRLLRMSHDMEVIPDLAVTWEPSEDGLEWTFELRGGVTFHNGTEFTADHVVGSFERMLDPDEGVAIRSQYQMIERLEATSDTVVVMHLSSVYADLPGLLTGDRALIFDRSLVETLNTEPIGTGPFKMKSYHAGERTVLERFEDYYDLENEGFVDEIHYISIPEETSRVTALTGGTVDIIPEISPAILPTLEGRQGIEVDEIVTGRYSPIVMNASEPPFDDNRVRLALKLCADRDEVLQAVLQGHGETATDHPIASIDPLWADIGIPQRDIDRARELLAEAGYPDGIDLELHTSPGRPGMQEVALAIQEMSAPAGFRIEVINHPIDVFWAEIWMQRPFTLSNWSAYPVADMALSVAYQSESDWNEGYWHNERFDELVQLGRETLDEDERLEIYREIQELMAEEGPSVIAYFASFIGAWSSKVQGYRLHPLQNLELSWVWLEDD